MSMFPVILNVKKVKSVVFQLAILGKERRDGYLDLLGMRAAVVYIPIFSIAGSITLSVAMSMGINTKALIELR